jgi:hypothetical protein
LSHEKVFDEDRFALTERGDETIAPVLAEPLYRSLSHVLEPTSPVLGFHRYKSRPLVLTRFGNTLGKLSVGR